MTTTCYCPNWYTSFSFLATAYSTLLMVAAIKLMSVLVTLLEMSVNESREGGCRTSLY